MAILLAPGATRAAVQFPGRVVTVWRTQEGAPADIGSLAQTPDGWIWLGTSGGLFRFDGRRFYPYDLIGDDVVGPRNVSALSVDADGGLWAIYAGHVVVHRAADGTVAVPPGLPDGPMGAVFYAADGTPMVPVTDGLYVLVDGRWVRCASPQWTLPKGKIVQAFVDRKRSLVVSAGDGIYTLAEGSTRFSKMDGVTGRVPEMFPGTDGVLWYASGGAMRPIPGAHRVDPAPGRSDAARTVADTGGLWWTGGDCVNLCYRPEAPATGWFRTPLSAVVDFPRPPDGLLVVVTMPDSAGNLWVGGKDGLARIRTARVEPVRHDGGTNYFSLAPLGDGRMLVGTDDGDGPDVLWTHAADGSQLASLGSHPETAMAVDPDGSVLMGGPGTLARFRDGKVVPEPFPAGFDGELVHQLLVTGPGSFWASVRHQGLFRVDRGTWIKGGGVTGLPDDWPLALVADGRGGLYAGYKDGQLFETVGTRASALGDAAGTSLGTVSSILPGKPLLAGGERGMAWYDGRRFRPVSLRMQGILRGVTGIVRSRNGDVWANARAGLVRLRAKDVERMVAGDADGLPFDLVDESVGMPGGSQQTRPLPTITPDGQGKLWVATVSGLAVVADDIDLPPSRPLPVILGMRTDVQALPPSGGTLAATESMLAVTYTGLSLVDAAHIQFRFRLVGVDDGWRTASGPGTLQYMRLPAGSLRFEIQARGTSGDWSPVVSSGPVVRKPSLLESTWFRVVAACVALLLLLTLYLARVRTLQRRAAERASARLAERDRIARELHDSMLQGMMGVAMRLEAWEVDERMPAWVRPGLAQTTRRLLALLLEGRARVIALRSTGAGQMALSEALRLIGEDHAANWPARFSVTVSGDEHAFEEDVKTAVVDILREAVHNAFVHAEPGSVSVTLDYTGGGLVALVDDDGKGLPEEVRASGKRPGHWGLVTMRERAERIGAAFSVTSDDIGTCVNLIVPAPRSATKRWWARFAGH